MKVKNNKILRCHLQKILKTKAKVHWKIQLKDNKPLKSQNQLSKSSDQKSLFLQHSNIQILWDWKLQLYKVLPIVDFANLENSKLIFVKSQNQIRFKWSIQINSHHIKRRKTNNHWCCIKDKVYHHTIIRRHTCIFLAHRCKIVK